MYGKYYPNILRVDVTENDINEGEIGQPQSCPIALALERMFPDNWEVSVGGNIIRVDGHVYMSEQAMQFVDEFDGGGPVSPCEIVLERSGK